MRAYVQWHEGQKGNVVRLHDGLRYQMIKPILPCLAGSLLLLHMTFVMCNDQLPTSETASKTRSSHFTDLRKEVPLSGH